MGRHSHNIERIFFHHSAAWAQVDGKLTLPTVSDIVALHTGPVGSEFQGMKCKGWYQAAYHVIVDREGKPFYFRPPTVQPAAQRGHNRDSLAVCAIGWNGSTAPDTDMAWNEAQIATLRSYVLGAIKVWPHLERNIFGHNDYVRTICPGLTRSELHAMLGFETTVAV